MIVVRVPGVDHLSVGCRCRATIDSVETEVVVWSIGFMDYPKSPEEIPSATLIIEVVELVVQPGSAHKIFGAHLKAFAKGSDLKHPAELHFFEAQTAKIA